MVTLDRPDVLNAFDDEMGAETLARLEDASADPGVRCIVVTGSGRAFSSGEDLGALSSIYEGGRAPDLGDTLVKRYNPTIKAITKAPKPVIAAVNGVAAGAGASIALACDYRLASDKAKMVFAFVNAGLVPDSGAVWFLTRMIGAVKAWDLVSTGRVVGADEALTLGLFDSVTDTETFESEWRTRAAKLAAGPTKAYALTKQLLYGATGSSLDDQLETEVDAQTIAGGTNDHLEGMRAFLEKRAPNFSGS